jgi:curved DNA-binding protein CbpA
MSPPVTDAPDHYRMLQVDPEADPDVIQAAYRRLAQKNHPDLAHGPEAAARMVAINRAWEILGNPASRAAYDRERASRAAGARNAPQAGSPPPATSPATSSVPNSSPADSSRQGSSAANQAPGGVLNFGRYAGWSLAEIGRVDLEYIEWLDRMPIGRPYREEIDGILRRSGRRKSAAAEAAERRGLFRRR